MSAGCECYRILVGNDIRELEHKVHDAIAQGLMPCGGLCASHPADGATAVLFQAVCTPAALVNTSALNALKSLGKAFMASKASGETKLKDIKCEGIAPGVSPAGVRKLKAAIAQAQANMRKARVA